MNQQVSSYIRGQLTVAFLVGVMFTIGFSIIGLDYAVTIGIAVSYTHLRAHETVLDLVCRLLLEKKKNYHT